MPRRILIVDSVCTNRILSSGDLGSARIETECHAGAPSARLSLVRHLPDLVIVGLGEGQPGIDFIAELRERRDTQALPIIAIGHAPTQRDRLAALRAGASEVFTRPVASSLLVARIRSLLRRADALAELRPDGDTQRALGFAEDPEGFEGLPVRAQVCLVTGRAGSLAWPLDALSRHFGPGTLMRSDGGEMSMLGQPDLIVLDGAGGALELSDSISRAARGRCLASGALFRQIADIRTDPLSKHSAILAVVPPGATDLAVMSLDLGATDVVTPEVGTDELTWRARGLIAAKRVEDRVRTGVRDGLQAAVTDPLTGLHNRRYAMPTLNRLAAEARLERKSLAVLVLDIDHFKAINDRHGHAAGDAVLAEVARRLLHELRPGDLLARIGGEEFLVALPDTTEAEAEEVAERLRRAISDRPVPLAASGPAQRRQVPVTMSVGVALTYGGKVSDAAPTPGTAARAPEGDRLYMRADAALYTAKAEGRNRVRMDHEVAAA